MPEIGVDSWVNSEVFEVEFAGIDIINDNENEIRKDGSLWSDFLDDNVVLVGVDENDWVLSLEDQLEGFEVLVEDLDLDFAVLVEDFSFVEVGGVD